MKNAKKKFKRCEIPKAKSGTLRENKLLFKKIKTTEVTRIVSVRDFVVQKCQFRDATISSTHPILLKIKGLSGHFT